MPTIAPRASRQTRGRSGYRSTSSGEHRGAHSAVMESGSLAGRTIAVPETRELEVFAAMLERRGARVLRCPLVAIRDPPHPAPVLDWCRRFAAGGCDDLIVLTGEGLRRLLGCIEQHEPSLRETLVAQLARARKITRGPKPARA